MIDKNFVYSYHKKVQLQNGVQTYAHREGDRSNAKQGEPSTQERDLEQINPFIKFMHSYTVCV